MPEVHDALFDSKERAAALDVSKSFIVQAPAGSGKTELLIQRILSLLCHVKKPEEILAITFTRKAANEMRLRVINALKSSRKAKPISHHAEKTWLLANTVMERDAHFGWGLMQNPNQLNIQTIDSLCSYLTKQLPLLSQFGAPPRIINQPEVLHEKAIDEILSHLDEDYPWQRQLHYLLLHLDNNIPKLKELLINLLSKRDQWIPYLKYTQQGHHAKQQLEQYIALFIEEKLLNINAIFPKVSLQELSRLAHYCASNLKSSKEISSLEAFGDNASSPTTSISDLKKWVALAEFMLTKKGELRKKATTDNGFLPASDFKNAAEKASHEQLKKDYLAILSSLNDNELLQKSLHDLVTLPDPTYSPTQWKTLYALLDILKVLLAQLRVSFQESGQIDFIENTQAALLSLGDEDHPTNLTLALDYQFKHILIDEFQDTSITQFQLLEKLISGWDHHDGKSIFIVGDPMQSIYRFRDAEVGLFIRIWKTGLKNKALERLSLSVNFRSTNQIVEWNNQHFSKLFPMIDLISDGAVSFSHSMTPNQHNASDSFIEVLSCDKNQLDAEAAMIANKVKVFTNAYPKDSIAILVRSRSHIKAIIPALKNEQISFQAAEIDNLYSKQPIKDLIALTTAILDLSNKTAWLAVLRAPWCGLTLTDLSILTQDEKTPILWYRLINSQIIDQLSDDGKHRLTSLLNVLKGKLNERDRVPFLELIESTWMLLGGPACLDNDTTQDDIEFFFSLLDSAQHTLSPYTVHQFEALIKRSYASSHENSSRLSIMTIHAAKGLEFDTVIIPRLEKTLPHNDKELLTWLEYPLSNQSMALLLAPLQSTAEKNDLLHDFIYKQQKIKLDYEVDRLLYVAATRAKKRLLLTFSTDFYDENNNSRTGSFLHKLWPHIKDEYLKVNELPVVADNHTSTHQPKLFRRLSRDWHNPIQTNVKAATIHNKKLGFSLKDDTPRLVGNIIHALLQVIAKKGLAWWVTINQQQKNNIILSYQRLMNVPIHLHKNSHTKIMMDLDKATSDPVGRWILQSHQFAESEYAISINDEKQSNLVIDRTFIDEQNVRWIVDYKTMDTTSSELEKHIETYQSQLEHYRHAFKLIESREIKMGLYFTALPAWREIT